jgi:predicted RNA binding protein YcfA (HicA-like mRNA interferase family)
MPVSGKEMLKQYEKAGWTVISREGSHIKIGKENLRETIPMHKELRKGLEQKLLKRLRAEGGK